MLPGAGWPLEDLGMFLLEGTEGTVSEKERNRACPMKRRPVCGSVERGGKSGGSRS